MQLCLMINKTQRQIRTKMATRKRQQRDRGDKTPDQRRNEAKKEEVRRWEFDHKPRFIKRRIVG